MLILLCYNVFLENRSDYELVKKIPLEESLTYGPELLEDNYENIARGLLHDAASFSGYPEVVSYHTQVVEWSTVKLYFTHLSKDSQQDIQG